MEMRKQRFKFCPRMKGFKEDLTQRELSWPVEDRYLWVPDGRVHKIDENVYEVLSPTKNKKVA